MRLHKSHCPSNRAAVMAQLRFSDLGHGCTCLYSRAIASEQAVCFEPFLYTPKISNQILPSSCVVIVALLRYVMSSIEPWYEKKERTVIAEIRVRKRWWFRAEFILFLEVRHIFGYYCYWVSQYFNYSVSWSIYCLKQCEALNADACLWKLHNYLTNEECQFPFCSSCGIHQICNVIWNTQNHSGWRWNILALVTTT